MPSWPTSLFPAHQGRRDQRSRPATPASPLRQTLEHGAGMRSKQVWVERERDAGPTPALELAVGEKSTSMGRPARDSLHGHASAQVAQVDRGKVVAQVADRRSSETQPVVDNSKAKPAELHVSCTSRALGSAIPHGHVRKCHPSDSRTWCRDARSQQVWTRERERERERESERERERDPALTPALDLAV
jgi:hypothetical protein